MEEENQPFMIDEASIMTSFTREMNKKVNKREVFFAQWSPEEGKAFPR